MNDRVLFRVFIFPDTGLDPDWVARRQRVRESGAALESVVPGSQSLRVASTAEYLHKLIVDVMSHHTLFPPQEGLERMNRRMLRRLHDGNLQSLTDVANSLWDAGYALTVAPLGTSVTVGPLTDPWLPFADSAREV